MKLRSILLVLAAALAAMTFAIPAQASGSQNGILDRFLPVLVFHPGEEFRPGTAQAFVEDSSLEAATSPTTWVVVDPAPSANDLPTESPPIWRLNQRDCFAGAPLGDLACYVATGGSRGEPTVYATIFTIVPRGTRPAVPGAARMSSGWAIEAQATSVEP